MMSNVGQGKRQASDGILVVDSNRRMVSINRKFIDMWSLPQHIIVSQNEEQALEFASLLVENTKSFLKSVEKIYIYTDLEIYDTITLKNGRILERHSMPQLLENKNVGRIWRFRELTECNCSKKVTAIEKKLLLFPLIIKSDDLLRNSYDFHFY